MFDCNHLAHVIVLWQKIKSLLLYSFCLVLFWIWGQFSSSSARGLVFGGAIYRRVFCVTSLRGLYFERPITWRGNTFALRYTNYLNYIILHHVICVWNSNSIGAWTRLGSEHCRFVPSKLKSLSLILELTIFSVANGRRNYDARCRRSAWYKYMQRKIPTRHPTP